MRTLPVTVITRVKGNPHPSETGTNGGLHASSKCGFTAKSTFLVLPILDIFIPENDHISFLYCVKIYLICQV